MRAKTYRDQFIKTLSPAYDALEAEQFFYLILEAKHRLKRVDLALNPALEFTETERSTWDQILAQLLQFVPIQYLLGKAHFYGLEFEVNENTLIPRPETEELVQWIISDHEFSDAKSILDIGTGSGCIAITLAKNLKNAAVSAIDVSEKALETAKRNAAANSVEVDFSQTDILQADRIGNFDIIVSNPPYVRNLENQEIRANVLEYEPHLALFVADDDALVFYRKIANLALESLSPNGLLYFEINQYLGAEMIEMLTRSGFNSIELRQDIYGNDRMIKATRPRHS